jgi:hypothetical protein
MQQIIDHNCNPVKEDVKQVVAEELKHIETNPDLKHLIREE